MASDSTTQLQALIDRFVKGDESARDELIGRAYQRLRRLAHKMLDGFPRLRPVEDTDDLLHDSLPRLSRALGKVQPASVGEFFQLATRHMRWELLELVRRPWQPSQHPDPLPDADNEDSKNAKAFEAPASSYNPVVLAQWTEFHEAVELLPEIQRQVFELVWYQGLTQAEAAAVLEIAESTVRRHWMAARLRLGAFFDEPSGE